MTLVLILPAWLILLALVVGLCAAARAGDGVLTAELERRDSTGIAGPHAEEYIPRPAGMRGAGARGRVPAGNVAA